MFSCIIFPVCLPCVVDARLCILKEQLDPANGRLRWGIASKDRCDCERVVAPKFKCTQSCARKAPFAGHNREVIEMWYIDEPKLLTMTENWTQERMDELLERVDLCCKLIFLTRKTNFVVL